MNTHPKENTQKPALEHNNTSSASCQEKTLVSDNTIFENMNHFEIYPHCIVFKKRKINNPSKDQKTRPRSNITHFSKRARFRLFELLSKIENNLEFPPIFVSLTYHHGHQNDSRSTKSHFHNFLVQLRNYDPGVQFIWRIENQKRGAPHYHLIIFPAKNMRYHNKDSYTPTIQRIWHNLADPKSRKHKDYGCKVNTINSYREACIYLSKYIAKVPENEDDIIEGKHWGNSRNLPIKHIKTIGCWDEEAKEIILRIRIWLMNNGKSKYADPVYLNIHTNSTIFFDFERLPDLIIEEIGSTWERSP